MEAGGDHSLIFGNSLYLTFVQSSSTVALGEVRWLLLWTNRNGARVKKNENLGGGGDFWSVQFKRGLTQVKFASMVVLFWGESLIWFWGRHFFCSRIRGGCCCSISE